MENVANLPTDEQAIDLVYGIDVGAASVGWAVISHKQQKILGIGSYIFPVGVKEDSYSKSFKEESKTKARTTARGARRRLFRRKLRTTHLLFLLDENGFFDDIFGKPQQLRQQYREAPRYMRSQVLKQFWAQVQQYMKEKGHLSTDIYRWRTEALDKEIPLWQLGLIFLQFAKRRGFKSNRKADKSQDDKQKGEVLQGITKIKQAIEETNSRTLGEYFYGLILQNPTTNKYGKKDTPVERIRKRYTERALYEKEFDLIWSKQQAFHQILTGDKTGDFRNLDFRKTTYYQIKHWAIFFQRPLKSQKKLVGKCTFFPHRKRCPMAAIEFQEFRIWKFLGDLRITTASKKAVKLAKIKPSLFPEEVKPRYFEPLTLEEKQSLAELFAEKEKVTIADIRKKLGYDSATFSAEDTNYKGNVVRIAFKEAFKDDFEELEREYKQQDAQDAKNAYKTSERFKTKFYRLWNALLFADSSEWLKEYAIKLGFSPEQAERYANIQLPDKYASLSLEAIRAILAYMKEGHEYDKACLHAGFHHSHKQITIKEKISKKDIPNLRNPLVQKAVNETARIINQLIAKYGKPDQIRIEMAREFKKPKKEREKRLNQNRNIEKRRAEFVEILKKYKPDWDIRTSSSIVKKFELWLELGLDNGEIQKEATKHNIDIKEFQQFAKKVTPKDEQKYKLWLECGRVSPYSGKVITLTKLFSSDIEVEHIFPYSLTGDDSMANKTIAEKEENAQKGNMTAMAYMKTKGEVALKSYMERIKNFPTYKQNRLLAEQIPDGFANADFTNTAYIAKEITKAVRLVCQDVRVTNGQATAFIRRQWGLNTVIRNLWEEAGIGNEEFYLKDGKPREDHRHHAIDALVIALTNQSLFNKMAREAQFSSSGNIKIEIPTPWGTIESFRAEVKQTVARILVAYRTKRRLLDKKKDKKGEQKVSLAPRDQLHAETNYGIIKKMNDNGAMEEHFVLRKSLLDYFGEVKNEEKAVEKCEAIVDVRLAAKLLERLRAYNYEGKKAFSEEAIKENPVLSPCKNGQPNPVHKVRFMVSSTTFIQLKPTENPKLYVKPDNNYIMAIYRDEQSGESDYQMVTFIEAISKKKQGLTLFPPKKIKDVGTKKNPKTIELPLWNTVAQKDMFVLYQNHPDEIDWENKAELSKRLYYVIKTTGGSVYLGKHHIAGIDADKDPKPIKYNLQYSTLKGVKVRVNALGEIVRI